MITQGIATLLLSVFCLEWQVYDNLFSLATCTIFSFPLQVFVGLASDVT